MKPVIALEKIDNSKNNKLGVHVLGPGEINQAAKLVNDDGRGQWGYVTVPIQAGDRDRVKWKEFFNNTAKLKVIPIIRVATVPIGANWDEPNNYDLVDFANFLNEMPWPVENRYIIIFNEVNRANEYGGFVSPEKYADILVNATRIFKERSQNFFILQAGLDNAAPSNSEYLNWKEYLKRMWQKQPDVFNQIDGWTSHAYPNPAFAGKPTDKHNHSIWSYQFDLEYLKSFTNKELPVFITETGWDSSKVKPERIADYYETAFSTAWSDSRVVAVTPFLLHAAEGPFKIFSLLNTDWTDTVVSARLRTLSRKGEPRLANIERTLERESKAPVSIPSAGFFWSENNPLFVSVKGLLDVFTKLILTVKTKDETLRKIQIAGREIEVEVANTPLLRQRGLSGRSILPENQGMLFEFENFGYHVFWMKDMKFNLDLVFVKDEKVIEIIKAYASEPLKLYVPHETVNRVIELNINSGVKVGDSVKL